MIYSIFDKKIIDYTFFDHLLACLTVIGSIILFMVIFFLIASLINKIKEHKERKEIKRRLKNEDSRFED